MAWFFCTQNVFWFSLQLLSEAFLIPWRTELDIIKHVHWSSCKVLIIVVHFIKTWIFSADFRKIRKCQFYNNQPSGRRFVSCGQTDGHVYKTKPTVAFRNFANTLLISHFSNNGATKHWQSNFSDINWNKTCTSSFTFSANLNQILFSKSLR